MKIILKYLRMILCFSLLFLDISNANINAVDSSFTQLGGIIDVDTVLTLENSPYEITSTLEILPTVTLTIEAGVHVVGTIDDPNKHEIRINDDAILIVGDDSRDSITLLENVSIKHDETYSFSTYPLASVVFNSVRIVDSAIYLRNANMQLLKSNLENTVVSLLPVEAVNVNIENNLFIHESRIDLFSQDNSTITIINNTFSNDINHDIFIDTSFYGDASGVIINGNNFLSLNKEWIIKTDSYGVDSIVNATNNYWRTINPEEIGRLILDQSDNYNNKIRVDYSEPLEVFNTNAPYFEEVQPLIIKPAKAKNDLSGTLSGVVNLTIEDSPYIIETILDILPGAILNIEPGVIINGYVSESDSTKGIIRLNQNATLNINGLLDNQVQMLNLMIDSSEQTPAANSFELTEVNFLNIQGSIFDNSQVFVYDTIINVSDSIFRNTSPISAEAFNLPTLPSIDTSIDVLRNIFELDSNIKIYVFSETEINIESNTFNNDKIFDIAISNWSDAPVLSKVRINNNNFLNLNKEVIVYTYSHILQPETLNMRTNYWRTTNNEDIKGFIHDHQSDYLNSITVDYSDFLSLYDISSPDYEFDELYVMRPVDPINTLKGQISTDTVLYPNAEGYILKGYLDVLPGVKLTISAGTSIQGIETYLWSSGGMGIGIGQQIRLHGNAQLNIEGIEDNNIELNDLRVTAYNETISEDVGSVKIHYANVFNSDVYINGPSFDIAHSVLSQSGLTVFVAGNINSINNNLFTQFSNLNILDTKNGVLNVVHNTFFNGDLNNSSSDSSADITVRAYSGQTFSGITIQFNNFLYLNKQYFLTSYSVDVAHLDLRFNYFRNISESTLDRMIYDNKDNDSNLSFVNYSSTLTAYNENAPMFDYYYLSGVETGMTYSQQITINHNYSNAILNGLPIPNSYDVIQEGEYTLLLQKDDLTYDLITFNLDFAPDITPPIITVSEYITTPTNQDITVTASTNEGTLNQESYTFTENGSFTFIATDEAGNVTEETVTIINIDKVAPIITVEEYVTTLTNQDITVNVSTNEGTLNQESYTFTENGSFTFIAIDDAGNISEETVIIANIDKTFPIVEGVENQAKYNTNRVILFDKGRATLNDMPIENGFEITQEGNYELIVIDDANNKVIIVFTIDKTPPIIKVNQYITTPTNQNITVNVVVNEGTLNESSHTFTENGSFTFIASDEAGNVTEKVVTITNIDKVPPVITVKEYITTPTSQSITVNVTTNEGTLNQSSHTFTENGSFTFIATDDAGNKTEKIITITNIINNVEVSTSVIGSGGKIELYFDNTLITSNQISMGSDLEIKLVLERGIRLYQLKVNGSVVSVVNNRFVITSVSEPVSIEAEFIKTGDLNGDGAVTITDLVTLRRFLAGLTTLTSKGEAAADLDGNGSITITDLVRLRRQLAGLE